jgi:two-component system, OmpR family, sensor histidine kinase ChvG
MIRQPNPQRWVSALTLRIFAVNVIALLVLGGGVFYLDQLRLRLLDQRALELTAQTQLMAVALSELAPAQGNPQQAPTLDWSKGVPLLEQLAEIGGVRVRVLDAQGQIMQDSRLFLEATIAAQPLPAPGAIDWQSFRRNSALFFDRLIEDLAPGTSFPIFSETLDNAVRQLPEAQQALSGKVASALRRRLEDGIVIINIAVPIVVGKQVIGALLITEDTRDITRAVRRERATSFSIFCLALSITLLLSIFLSRTIAQPLKRLAVAADQVRLGRGREAVVPRFPKRNDEIGDLAQALWDMTQTLRQRMDAIEAFAADVAHELKNPLSSVRSAVEVLQKASSAQQRMQLLAIIQDDVGRMDRLISDISDASRLDAELSRAGMGLVDMRNMLETLVSLDSTLAEKQGVRLVFDKPAQAMTVLGIESRLGQVVRNLVSNALSFSPPGGVVRLILLRHQSKVRLCVEDEGPGIPEANKQDIFKRFYSERPATEAFGQHSGLGLAIAKQIVEAHGGLIWAENLKEPIDTQESGGKKRGACFIVDLPYTL